MAEMRWKRALVTGASTGIGAEFARELARRGTAVVAVARDVSRLEALAQELKQRHGVQVEVLGADLLDPTARGLVEARLSRTSEPVNLLVNNAGFGHAGDFTLRTADDAEAQIALNVTALVRLSHAAARRMQQDGKGGILNISSGLGFMGTPGFATYSATKAFVNNFGLALHAELRSSGVRVTTSCPGMTRTEFQVRAGADVTKGGAPDALWMTPEAVATQSLKALDAGTALYTVGLANRVMTSLAQALPANLVTQLTGRLMGRSGA